MFYSSLSTQSTKKKQKNNRHILNYSSNVSNTSSMKVFLHFSFINIKPYHTKSSMSTPKLLTFKIYSLLTVSVILWCVSWLWINTENRYKYKKKQIYTRLRNIKLRNVLVHYTRLWDEKGRQQGLKVHYVGRLRGKSISRSGVHIP